MSLDPLTGLPEPKEQKAKTMNNSEREAFEAWFARDGNYEPEQFVRSGAHNDLYLDHETENLWQAFQAGRATLAAKPAAPAMVPQDTAKAIKVIRGIMEFIREHPKNFDAELAEKRVGVRLDEIEAALAAARDAQWAPLIAERDEEIARLQMALDHMADRKDGAYLERNRVVAALASAFPSGIAKTAIEGWSEDWHGCVYIDLPTGQASWHYHDSQAWLFEHLPPYPSVWDGHSTDEKYQRLEELRAAGAKEQP